MMEVICSWIYFWRLELVFFDGLGNGVSEKGVKGDSEALSIPAASLEPLGKPPPSHTRRLMCSAALCFCPCPAENPPEVSHPFLRLLLWLSKTLWGSVSPAVTLPSPHLPFCSPPTVNLTFCLLGFCPCPLYLHFISLTPVLILRSPLGLPSFFPLVICYF